MEKPEQEKEPGESNQENGDLKPTDEEPRRSLELPTNVGVKLRKLEKLESRYHGTYSISWEEVAMAEELQSFYDRTASHMLEYKPLNPSRRPFERIPHSHQLATRRRWSNTLIN